MYSFRHLLILTSFSLVFSAMAVDDQKRAAGKNVPQKPESLGAHHSQADTRRGVTKPKLLIRFFDVDPKDVQKNVLVTTSENVQAKVLLSKLNDWKLNRIADLLSGSSPEDKDGRPTLVSLSSLDHAKLFEFCYSAKLDTILGKDSYKLWHYGRPERWQIGNQAGHDLTLQMLEQMVLDGFGAKRLQIEIDLFVPEHKYSSSPMNALAFHEPRISFALYDQYGRKMSSHYAGDLCCDSSSFSDRLVRVLTDRKECQDLVAKKEKQKVKSSLEAILNASGQ